MTFHDLESISDGHNCSILFVFTVHVVATKDHVMMVSTYKDLSSHNIQVLSVFPSSHCGHNEFLFYTGT